MIKTYNEYTHVNEGNIRNAAIVGFISMSLLSSCRLFHHHRSKHDTKPPIELEAQPVETISRDIPATPKVKIISPEITSNIGKLPWPIERGLICGKFGNNKQGHITTNNDGIYIRTNENAKIRAVFRGKITKVFDVCGDMCIIITHEHYYSVYSGFNRLAKNIKVGTNVTEATVLGYSKPEMSFQFWKEKGTKAIPMNPEKVLIH